jgi:glycosyltransferase involved in cell wall biosynthesis
MADDGISVIIPAYNVDGFIAEAVASVAAQSRPVQEILVIDDGSTDGTAALLRNLAGTDGRLRVLASDRLGPGGARNVGLAAASQPIIAFLDGDDIWPRRKVERQMDRLAGADRPDVVSGLIQYFRKLERESLTPADERSLILPHVHLGAGLFRRQVFDSVGLFDERLTYSEDIDLMFRIREAGLKLAIMREVTLYYRRRPGSMTQVKSGPKDLRVLEAMRLSIGRRRNAGRAINLPSFIGLIDK